MQPLPALPSAGFPIMINSMPSGAAAAYLPISSSRESVMKSLRLPSASSLESTMLGGIFLILSASSRPMPSVSARLGLGSPSIARTLQPSPARMRARVPATVVLPDPPLPTVAIFIDVLLVT